MRGLAVTAARGPIRSRPRSGGAPRTHHLEVKPHTRHPQAHLSMLAACDALVPKDGSALLQAVAGEAQGIYRRRYGLKTNPFEFAPVDVGSSLPLTLPRLRLGQVCPVVPSVEST